MTSGRILDTVAPTPERLAKGGLTVYTDAIGNVTSVEPADTTILGRLIKRGVLEHHHRSYADTYLEHRRIYLHPAGFKGNFARFGQRGKGDEPDCLYPALVRELGKRYLRLIDYGTAIDGINFHPALCEDTQEYAAAFRALAKVIDSLRKR